MYRVQGTGFRVQGVGFRTEGVGVRVWDLHATPEGYLFVGSEDVGFWVSGLGLRASGFGFWVCMQDARGAYSLAAMT